MMRGIRVTGIAIVFAMAALLGLLGWGMRLFSAQQPILQVSPSSLSFQGQVDGPTPDPQALIIANAGGGLMEWHASTDVDWIILGGTEGKLSGGRAIKMWVFVDIEGLSAGTYQGTIKIEAPGTQGSPVVVSVILTLTRPAYTVCTSGCPFTEIQAAIDSAGSGETITIGPGTYRENIKIEKSLTLRGTGSVVIQGEKRGYPILWIESQESIDVMVEGLTIIESVTSSAFPSGCAVEDPEWICPNGIQVRGKARATIKDSRISNTRLGIQVWWGAQATIQNTVVSGNADGIIAWGNIQVTMENTIVSGNRDDGLDIDYSAIVVVRDSSISNNGTGTFCRSEEYGFCNGIQVTRDSRLTIINSKVTNNANWGVAAWLKKCGASTDHFTGRVVFEGDNVIEGNNTSGIQDGMGNPGDHPWNRPDVPDGQVCLP